MYDIFYFNINYTCNQDCVFCFSHNTKTENNVKDLSVECFSDIIKSNNIQPQDRIIINGGEPTIHPGILDILKLAVLSRAEVVLYSNGQMLKNKTFAHKVINSGIARITIPFHGYQENHDAITRTIGSYENLVQKAIPNITTQSVQNLEPKFIVTSSFLEDGFNMIDFLTQNNLFDFSKSIVITAQVNTIKAQRNNSIFSYDKRYNSYLESQIISLSQKKPVKIIDFRLCDFSEEFRDYIQSLESECDDVINQYIFFDSNIPEGKNLNYVKERKLSECVFCSRKKYCRSILDSYLVLEIFKNTKKLVWE